MSSSWQRANGNSPPTADFHRHPKGGVAEAIASLLQAAHPHQEPRRPRKPQHILITGGAGVVGRFVAERERSGVSVKSGPDPELTSHEQRKAIREMEASDEIASGHGVSHSTVSRLTSKTASRRLDRPEKIDAETERAVRTFLQKLVGRYSVQDAMLFGSRARRDHRVDSDADLIVVLKGEKGDRSAATRDMASLAFDAMLETGVLVEPLPLWESELERPELLRNPALLHNIERDGLRL